MTGAASKSIAGCFALAAFAVAVIAGLAGGNPAAAILLRALIAMVACYPVGLVIGLVCQHVIEQQVSARSRAETGSTANAVPEGGGGGGASQNAESAQEAEDVIVV